jgi:hypothetical protein
MEIFIIDKRKNESQDGLAATDFPLAVWAEGDHFSKVRGESRYSLQPSNTLVVWTAPPSYDVFHETIYNVKPEKTIVFGIDPDMDDPNNFLSRLAGIVKFVINQRNGITCYSELAASTSQTIDAVIFGLEFLSKKGLIRYLANKDEIRISQSELQSRDVSNCENVLVAIMDSTRQFRQHFIHSANISLLSLEQFQPFGGIKLDCHRIFAVKFNTISETLNVCLSDGRIFQFDNINIRSYINMLFSNHYENFIYNVIHSRSSGYEIGKEKNLKNKVTFFDPKFPVFTRKKKVQYYEEPDDDDWGNCDEAYGMNIDVGDGMEKWISWDD